MMQRRLGTGGPMVSAFGLGCLSFGGTFGPTTDADSQAVLDAAWDQGITLFDTANIYGAGRSETQIGTWMRRTGHRPVLATKAGFSRAAKGGVDNAPAHLCAASASITSRFSMCTGTKNPGRSKRSQTRWDA